MCKDFHFDIPTIRKYCDEVPDDVFETDDLLNDTTARWEREGEDFKKFPYSPIEEITAVQTRNTISVVEYAFEHVPFYRDLYKKVGYKSGDLRTLDDLKYLPIINKQILSQVDLAERTSAISDPREHFLTSTSGSSGKSLQILYGRESVQRESFEYYRQFNIMLKGRSDPKRWIYNLHMSRGWVSSLNGLYPTFTLHEAVDLDELVQHLRKLRPQVFCMLASYLKHLLPIAEEMRNAGVELIVTNSETSSREERAFYSEKYGLPILDDYSSCEAGIIACECGHGRYHINSDGVYLELVGDGDWGETVVTDFRNLVMPVIRYNQGDIAKWDDIGCNCKCGQKTPGFSEVLGRKDDSFLKPDGTEIPSASLLNAIDEIFTDTSGGLDQYRLVERDIGVLELVFVLRNDAASISESHLKRLKDQLKVLYTGQVSLTSVPVSKMPKLGGYKRRKVISDRKAERSGLHNAR
ncbi:phenylacetate--CoA ligase family protein [Roseibium sp. ROS1]